MAMNHDAKLSELFIKIGGVSHLVNQNGYIDFNDFRKRYVEILKSLSDAEITELENRFSNLRYMNVILQAQISALENEIRIRKM